MRLERFTSFIIAAAAAIFLVAAPLWASGGGAHWGYEGEAGPEHWGDLSHEYEACKAGKSQSPIDISGAAPADLDGIKTDYDDTPLSIVNNGHAIQVNYAPGSTMTVDGKTYALLQFHFHGPSENTVGGEAYDMEAHLVHKSSDGKLAVIGVLFRKGEKNGLVETLWENLPPEEGHEKKVDSVKVNAAGLLTKDMDYYSFEGSLTTPPCSEGVKWMVLKTPLEVSEEQIERFAEIFPMNARPVQPLNGRVVSVSR